MKETLKLWILNGEGRDLPPSFEALTGYSVLPVPSDMKTDYDECASVVIALIDSAADLESLRLFRLSSPAYLPVVLILSDTFNDPVTALPDHRGILPFTHSPLLLKEVLTRAGQSGIHGIRLPESEKEAFFLMSPSGRFLNANRNALELFEVASVEDFCRLNPIILSPEYQFDGSPSVPQARLMMEEALKKGSCSFEWVHKKNSGELFQAEVRLNRIEPEGDTVILGHLNVAGESRDDEARAEKVYRTAIENLSIGVVVHGADSSILFSNPAAQTILGVSREQMEGKQVTDPEWHFVDEEGHPLTPEEYPVSLVMKNKKELVNRIYGIGRSDRDYTTWVMVNALPIIDDDGFLKKVMVNFYDITKYKKLQEDLNHSRKMDAVGILAGGVAHDFNNMLAGIVSSAELIRNLTPSENPANTYIDIILQSAQRAADLNNQLLSFARKGKMSATPVNVHVLLDRAVKEVGRSVDKRIRISSTKKASHHTVRGDDTQLQSSFINLCTNAAQAMPRGGEITVSTENIDLSETFCRYSPFDLKPGHYLLMEFHDSGEGISPENQKRIFEPFFTTRPSGKGTGLGLASVYGTVEQHGGAVSVYSELGVGTSFHLYLPVSQDHAPIRRREIPAVKGTGTILLVDDEQIIRLTAREMLEALNYTVLSAENGREALKLYKEKKDEIDLVIMDMVMPLMNGREAFDRIREEDPAARILLSSGFTRAEDLQAMMDNGLCGYVRKPYRRSELSRAVADALEGAGGCGDPES